MTSENTGSTRFMRTRADHARETAEDYVELILVLSEELGEARSTDIAQRLGISQVTVSQTLRRLIRDGLITAEPYRSIFLTESGRELAERSRDRHQVVVQFLRKIGVPDEIAEVDAEGIEHHVSETTLSVMRRHLEFD
ncbi:MAG: manganese-binding transcriptional regulator MntR [Armatimonadetes bacterium]|nr:manganese-binding transcriptional regulator MntR [Armatimonadota bacterium]